jgi:hypothetical protein
MIIHVSDALFFRDDIPTDFDKSNTTCVTSGAGTAYLSGAPESHSRFQWGSCCSIVSFLCSVVQIAIVLSILRFEASD